MSSLDIDVSFIIPAYNAEQYIEECLESICLQDGIEKEIIVIDDGSKDNTLNILDECQKKYDNIQVVKQEHRGASVARNTGIELAKGRWICFVDSDDYLAGDCIRDIIKQCTGNEDVIFAEYSKVKDGEVSSYIYSEQNEEFEEKNFEVFQRATLNKNYNPLNLQVVTPWTKLYKGDFLKESNVRFTPGVRKSQDLLFNFEVYQKAVKGKYIHKQMYAYRYNKESLCNKYLPGVIEDYLKQAEKIKGLLNSYGKFDAMKSDFYFRCGVNFMFSIRLDYAHADNSKTYKERKSDFLEALEYKEIKKALLELNTNELTLIEKILWHCVKRKNFRLICFLNRAYGLIEKWR